MEKFVYIETRSQEDPDTQRILRSLGDCRVYEIRDHRRLEEEDVPHSGYDSKIKKKARVLAHHPGPFIRPFPVSDGKDEPTEFFIAHANGCPMDCRYCFLQSYFGHGAPVVFTNTEDLLQEMEEHLEHHAKAKAVTYHAGEFSDAMAMESLSGFASRAIPVFSRHPLATLELRTKCAEVENLLPDDPPVNIVVSWTLTPREAWQQYEPGTPGPSQRLQSARACRDKGYQVGIRLDPALLIPGWEKAYEGLILEVYRHLEPGTLESFVLGGFRYTPSLGAAIRERFPSCDLLGPEFVMCRDGKHRYLRPLRVNLYRKIIQEIRKHDGQSPIRLCMETEQVTQDVQRGNKEKTIAC